MNVHTNIPLKNYLTMKLGGPTRFMTDALSSEELANAIKNAKSHDLDFYILGSGSNTIATEGGYKGIIIRNRIMGFEVLEETPSTTTIKVGAGEDWDGTVAKTVEMSLTGIEAMSAIPGTCGAAPVQNIGAYGQEVADTLVSLEAYDSQTDKFVQLQNADCGFAYRHSMFRGDQQGRYAILSITLQLYKNSPQPPFYEALEKYFNERDVTFFTPAVIRQAVQTIRADKLPDPTKQPNTGSFFKNAIIDDWRYDELVKEWPDMPSYDMGEKRRKIPSGWLIEHAGFKNKLLHGMRVNPKNCLVLINESASSYDDLAAARDEIQGKVRDTFGILIEQEPLQLPA